MGNGHKPANYMIILRSHINFYKEYLKEKKKPEFEHASSRQAGPVTGGAQNLYNETVLSFVSNYTGNRIAEQIERLTTSVSYDKITPSRQCKD